MVSAEQKSQMPGPLLHAARPRQAHQARTARPRAMSLPCLGPYANVQLLLWRRRQAERARRQGRTGTRAPRCGRALGRRQPVARRRRSLLRALQGAAHTPQPRRVDRPRLARISEGADRSRAFSGYVGRVEVDWCRLTDCNRAKMLSRPVQTCCTRQHLKKGAQRISCYLAVASVQPCLYD